MQTSQEQAQGMERRREDPQQLLLLQLRSSFADANLVRSVVLIWPGGAYHGGRLHCSLRQGGRRAVQGECQSCRGQRTASSSSRLKPHLRSHTAQLSRGPSAWMGVGSTMRAIGRQTIYQARGGRGGRSGAPDSWKPADCDARSKKAAIFL